jgi:hypothetical protein
MDDGYRFQEMGDFYVVSHGLQKAEDCWAAFVFFERKGTAVNDRAPAIRHHLHGDSGTEGEAIERGIQYAWECIKKGDTGL